MTQAPVSHYPRLRGKTKYGTWGRLVKGLGDLWAVRWMKKNRLDYDLFLEVFEADIADRKVVESVKGKA